MGGSFSPCAENETLRRSVSSCPALASPALFWLGFAHAQRVTERGRSRGGGGFRNVSFLHLQRTRQGREVGRPHGGRGGFRRGTKRSDAPTRGPLKLKPRRKGFLPFKLREALRKPRRLPAFNFGRRRPPAAMALSPSPPTLQPPAAPGPAAHKTPPAAFRPDALLPPRPPTPGPRPQPPLPAPGLVLPPSAAPAPTAPSNGNRCPRRPGCPAPPAVAQLLHAPRPTGMNPAALLAPPRPAELSAPALPGRSGCSGCRG